MSQGRRRAVIAVAALISVSLARTATAEEPINPGVNLEVLRLDMAQPAPTFGVPTGLSFDAYDLDATSDLSKARKIRGVYSPDGALSVGPVINLDQPRRSIAEPRLGNSDDTSTEVGAFVGYTVPTGLESGSSVGLNLEIARGVADETSDLRLQPGIEYGLPLTGALRLDARVFSTYAGEDEGQASGSSGDTGTLSGLNHMREDGSFRDVGVNLRLGYSMTESWDIETRASLTRRIGNAAERDGEDDGNPSSEFFGGVIINYKF